MLGRGELDGWAGVTRILDIGTGSGILALMLAQRHKHAVVEAVELEPDAARQAAENVTASPFSARISVHEMAVQAWDEADVDLVVCNPPFFHNHPKSPERKRNLARHDDTLPLHVLFAEGPPCDPRIGGFSVCVSHGQGRGGEGPAPLGWRLSSASHSVGVPRMSPFATFGRGSSKQTWSILPQKKCG